MKKNLRIVSAAAAALLAIAPIAVAAAPVNAAGISNVDSTKEDLNQVNWGIGSLNNNATVNVKSNLVLNAQNVNNGVKHSTLTGTITATVDGKDYTALYSPSDTKVEVFKTNDVDPAHALKNGTALEAGKNYAVGISSLKFNLGAANANKNITLTLPEGAYATYGTDGKQVAKRSLNVKVSSAGVVTLKDVLFRVTAKDLTNVSGVYFVNKDLGNVVTAGNVTLNANAAGEANTATVISAAEKAYTAYQVNIDNGKSEGFVSLGNDLADALKKANISVDANGFFKAPHTLTFNLTAKSSVNNASAKLPVTVTFANVAVPTPAQETGVSKTIMHVASIYDKTGKKTSDPEIHAYDTVSVVANPVTINGARYYKIANKDQYIKVGNIDGTQRTLNHNAYLYHRTSAGKFVAKSHKVGKKTRHVVVKKGTQETTYGSALYGKKYYRIGRNQYIKAANFR